MADPVYRPQVFDTASLDDAKRIILTPEEGVTTDECWEKETPWIAGALEHVLALKPEHTVIDYGCGIGRLARAFAQSVGCGVAGVDISPTMRAQAPFYVESPHFTAMAPEAVACLAGSGFRADHAYAVWVLQHCLEPEAEIGRIHNALKPGGLFAVINSRRRWLPTDQGWRSDGKDVPALLAEAFEEVAEHPLAVGPMSEKLVETSFFRVYRKPAQP